VGASSRQQIRRQNRLMSWLVAVRRYVVMERLVRGSSPRRDSVHPHPDRSTFRTRNARPASSSPENQIEVSPEGAFATA
jgi:hypothetical protein